MIWIVLAALAFQSAAVFYLARRLVIAENLIATFHDEVMNRERGHRLEMRELEGDLADERARTIDSSLAAAIVSSIRARPSRPTSTAVRSSVPVNDTGPLPGALKRV